MTDKLIIGGANNWSRGTLLWNLALDPRARPAQGRLRRLPRRGHDRSGDRRDHPQRRILCARPRQPLRASRRLSGRRRPSAIDGIEAAAFLNPDGSRVAILHRKSGDGSGRPSRSTASVIVVPLADGVGRDACAGGDRQPVTAAPTQPTLLAFAAVTSLFFAWGFITSNNDPLIVALRAAFSLNYTEALLTQIVFFLANGLLSLARGLADAAGSARSTRSSARWR